MQVGRGVSEVTVGVEDLLAGARATLVCDAEGRVVAAGAAAAEWLDRPPGELHGRLLGELHPSLVTAPIVRLLGAARERGMVRVPTEPNGALELTVVRASGDRFVVIIEDRVADQRAGAAAAAQLRAILDQEPECVKLVDREARLVEMNPAGLAMIAAPSLADVVGADLLEIVDPAYHEVFLEGLATVFRGEKVLQEFEIVALDGTRRWMEQHSAPLWDPDRPDEVRHMLAVTRDVSARKRTEEAMRRQERVDSVGRMAGILAHDLNNLLLPISLSLEELEVEVGERFDLVAPMRESVEHASAMLRDLLAFARGSGGDRSFVDVGKLLRSVTVLLEASLPADIDLRIEPSPEPLFVMGSSTALQQVFLNLAVNARDAMPTGGELSISVRQVPNTEGLIELRVKDTGTGISPAVRERIFEPFFSTKDRRKGSGLGLASALEIVRAHDGSIDVETELGVGTSFLVRLPTVQREPPSEPPAASADAVPGEMAILLVEDEPLVRRALGRELRRLGAAVTMVADLDAARAEMQSRDFDLIVSDLHLREGDGLQLLRELRSQGRPDPFLLVSGRLEKDAVAEVARHRAARCLSKPFDSATMREVLSALVPSKV